MRRETDRFEAISEEGNSCIIVELTTMVQIRTTTGQGWGRGSRSYATLDGRPINPLSNDQFEDVLSGERFVRTRE